jgi:hypothetical protein
MKSIRIGLWACLLPTLWLSACSPDQNWREIVLEGTAFKVQLPCKPDRATRSVVMNNTPAQLQVVGCESAGSMIAFMTVELQAGADANALMEGWQKVTLENMRADTVGTPVQQQVWHRPGQLPLKASLRLQAKGFNPNGQVVKLDAVWGAVAAGDRVRLIHAVVYAPNISPELANTLFEGLRP